MVRFVGCIIYDGIGLNLMLPFQDSTQNMTLNEGIECYRNYLVQNNRKILIDESGSTLIRDHDATHVIFGLDTTLEEESMLDSWVLWGTQYKFSYLNQYRKLPQLEDFSKNLFKELGISGFFNLLRSVLRNKITVFKRTRKMSKKWPFRVPEDYLEKSILDLRSEYGIDILSLEERTPKRKLKWSGSF